MKASSGEDENVIVQRRGASSETPPAYLHKSAALVLRRRQCIGVSAARDKSTRTNGRVKVPQYIACRIANRLHDSVEGELHLGRVNTLGFLSKKVTPRPLELEVRQNVPRRRKPMGVISMAPIPAGSCFSFRTAGAVATSTTPPKSIAPPTTKAAVDPFPIWTASLRKVSPSRWQ